MPEVVISLTLMRYFFNCPNTLLLYLRSFLRSFVSSFVPSFVPSFVFSFVRSFVPSFVRSFVCLFVECMAGTAGYGVVLNDQRVVRLH